MFSIYHFKSSFQSALKPIVQMLVERGITANQITLAAIGISILGGGFIVWQPTSAWPFLALPVFLFLRMAMNAIDGMLAREHNQQSNLGAILNELGDVLSDIALYLPLALVPAIYAPLVVIVVILAVVSEMTGILALTIGVDRQYQGPMGKSDRAVWFGLLGILLGTGTITNHHINWLVGVVLLLLILTILNRSHAALTNANAN